MAVRDAAAQPLGEDQYLDLAFEQAVSCFENGLEPEVSALLAGREHLARHVERLVELARRSVHGTGASGGSMPEIPGYEVLGELGRGGMGVVYLARQKNLGDRAVALKVLPVHAAMSARARERFRTEAVAIARLHHPNIVHVYDIVQRSDIYAYAMEWIDGRTLQDLIDHVCAAQRGNEQTRHADQIMHLIRELLDTPAGSARDDGFAAFVCRVGIQACRALDAVHAAGMLHRDVKPSNILIRRDLTALLSDFGLARDQDSVSTIAGTFIGTLGYASPEQFRVDNKRIDRRSDIYSLGATLYSALTLRAPTAGVAASDIPRFIEESRQPRIRNINPRISADLETIVDKAMAVDPDRRYASAGELGDDLERLISLRPIHARRAGWVGHATKLMRRNRRTMLAGIASALVVAVLCILIAFWMFVRPVMIAERWHDARQTLIASSPQALLFNREFWGRINENSFLFIGAKNPDKYAPAAAAYKRALILSPSDPMLRGEAMVVQFAQAAISKSPFRSIEDRFAIYAPHTADYLRWWDSTLSSISPASLTPMPAFPRTREFLTSSTPNDAALLGLAAYLLGDVDTAVSVWEQSDLASDPGALAETSLGLIYLIREEPARAYPRLRRGTVAFPGIANLALDAAEAAIRCKDVEKAGQMIEQAEKLPSIDPAKLTRLKVLLSFARGNQTGGLAEFERAATVGRGQLWTPVLSVQVGDELEASGQLEVARRAYSLAVENPKPALRPVQRVCRILPKVWAGMSKEQKFAALASCIHEGASDFGLGWTRSFWAWSIGDDGRLETVESAQHAAVAEIRAIVSRMRPSPSDHIQSWFTDRNTSRWEGLTTAQQLALVDWWRTGNTGAATPAGPR